MLINYMFIRSIIQFLFITHTKYSKITDILLNYKLKDKYCSSIIYNYWKSIFKYISILVITYCYNVLLIVSNINNIVTCVNN